MGAQAVRSEFSAPRVSYQRNGQPATFWGWRDRRSRRGDKDVVVTVVNPAQPTPSVHGDRRAARTINSYAIRALIAPALDAHNQFEQPNAVTAPPDMTPDWKGESRSILTLPKASVSRAALQAAWRRRLRREATQLKIPATCVTATRHRRRGSSP